MWGTAFMHAWATRNLRRGDLTALATLARAGTSPDHDQWQRLEFRGFVRAKTNGRASVTAWGRLALLARNFSRG
jgi:hypothetical protein